MGKDPRIDRLRAVPLFSGCTDKHLEFINTRVDEVDVAAGRDLTVEGKSGGEFFIVISGEADVKRGGAVVDTIKPGDFFGEIALLDNGPRTATVTARTPMHLLVLSPGQFQDVLHAEPEIAVTLIHAVTRRLRAATRPSAD